MTFGWAEPSCQTPAQVAEPGEWTAAGGLGSGSVMNQADPGSSDAPLGGGRVLCDGARSLGMQDSDLDILCLGHKFGGEVVFLFIL